MSSLTGLSAYLIFHFYRYIVPNATLPNIVVAFYGYVIPNGTADPTHRFFSSTLSTIIPLILKSLHLYQPFIVILRYTDIMGITKTQLFKKRQNRIATIAKAFDHPARVAILEYLLTNRTCITNDLVNELPLSQSTISQHLKELKQIGIIKGEVEGPKLNYCIDEQVWEEARDVFINFFAKYVPKNCC